ncbi:hypothetical protein ABT297_18175 [Dactylosporangium sp. NPDC000555]|uniref:hypothetical protein n=1 Tax=Dactylosporangium sp. NPDC000555 TaxID=3154260 RepID=UPI00331EEB65
MRSELPELLRDARTALPPPRFDVEDAVAAGRRLRTRRRVGRTGLFAAVTVVAAVAIAAVAPRLGVPAVPAETGDAGASAFDYPAEPLVGNIRPFTGERFSLSGTVHVTPGYQVAEVTRPDAASVVTGPTESYRGFSFAAGVVVVYRAGAFDPSAFAGGEPVPVGRRPGRYLPSLRLMAGLPDGPALAWQYADDAWAVVASTEQGRPMARDELAFVAAALRSGEPDAARLAFRLGHVPAGFTPQAAGTADGSLTRSIPGESYVSLVKGAATYTSLAGPVSVPEAGGVRLPTIELTLYRSWYAKDTRAPGEAFCQRPGLCYTSSPDGQWQIEAAGGPSVPDDELLRVLRSITVADPASPPTWHLLQDAVPSS